MILTGNMTEICAQLKAIKALYPNAKTLDELRRAVRYGRLLIAENQQFDGGIL